jgi:8-oxo-dGTP pyrophosphatase MutT (NUDIX family)
VLPDFIHKLKEELSRPLPGAQAQYLMAPLGRLNTNLPDLESLNPKKGSVLILLYPTASDYTVVFIKRTEYKGVHSGQVSFPGGKFEPADETDDVTALRETKEEIGIDDAKIHLLGSLTKLYIPPSNFLVSPFIGYVDFIPAFNPDAREVESVIKTSLSSLLDAFTKVREKQIKTSEDLIISAPFIDVCGHHLWGATAMISSEFIEVVRRIW